jgi:predicted DNA-binding WGR domain protein
VSRISRDRTVAYARKQKPTDAGDPDAAPDAETGEDAAPAVRAPAPQGPETAAAPAPQGPETAAAPTPQAPEATTAARSPQAPEAAAARAPQGPEATTAARAPQAPEATATAAAPPPAGSAAPSAGSAPDVAHSARLDPPLEPPPSVEPWADAPPPSSPATPSRARASTVRMPVESSIGGPPAMPGGNAVAAAPADPDAAESPTRMPGPREIPGGNPDDPASPPGSVPPGDSRSMRRRADLYEFALTYRLQTYVICRFGVVGTRGQWRVVEYPTSASASHAYAKEVSRFVSEGFSDYRD